MRLFYTERKDYHLCDEFTHADCAIGTMYRVVCEEDGVVLVRSEWIYNDESAAETLKQQLQAATHLNLK